MLEVVIVVLSLNRETRPSLTEFFICSWDMETIKWM